MLQFQHLFGIQNINFHFNSKSSSTCIISIAQHDMSEGRSKILVQNELVDFDLATNRVWNRVLIGFIISRMKTIMKLKDPCGALIRFSTFPKTPMQWRFPWPLKRMNATNGCNRL